MKWPVFSHFKKFCNIDWILESWELCKSRMKFINLEIQPDDKRNIRKLHAATESTVNLSIFSVGNFRWLSQAKIFEGMKLH